MPKPNVRQIEAFNAVMNSGSVTKAADALFISQPAVTKLVRAFEEACGLKLFSRTTGRLVPTPEARQLFVETERLEAGVTRVQKTAHAIRELERGEVSVVAFPGISMKLIPRHAAALLAKKPDVRLSLFTRTSRSIEDSMITRAADFGISLVPTDNPALRCQPFSKISLICALPKNHPLANLERVPIDSLKGERLIALGRDDLSYPVISEAFQKAGVRMQAAAEVQMADAACAMVSEGYGVAIVPSLMSVGPEDPQLVYRPLAQPVSMTMWLVTSPFGDLSQLALSLIESIRGAVEDLERGIAS